LGIENLSDLATLDTKKLENVLDQINSLPTLPHVFEKLILQIYDPNTSAERLAKSISADSALMSKIFRLVNSAYYGFPRKISTFTQAIVILGFNAIRNIVLTASVFNIFKESKSRFDYNQFWKHSLFCAVVSKTFSKHLRIGLPEEVFFAGLFHDIGKLILDQFFPDTMDKVLDKMENDNLTFYQAENSIVDMNHTDIGKLLCIKWNFPLIFQNAITFHHLPENASENKKLAYLLYISNIISKNDIDAIDIHSNCWKILNLSKDSIDNLMEDIHQDYEKASGILEIAK
jgi:putative nucleotidyltransferase with HDIG domain